MEEFKSTETEGGVVCEEEEEIGMVEMSSEEEEN